MDEKPKENDTLPRHGELGLTPPEGGHEFDVILRYLGDPVWVEEGRETFFALVPDRFKRNH